MDSETTTDRRGGRVSWLRVPFLAAGAPAPGSARQPLQVALLAMLVLGGLAALHPGLRFVDLVAFSARAQILSDRLVDPLYPIGYPALLAAAHTLGADVLVAAKGLSVLAGAATAAAATLLVGPAGAAWLLAQTEPLEWAITEGTDLPAAALCLTAVAAAARRWPWVAGLAAGAACLVRYTSLAVVPIVLVLEPRAWRGLIVAGLPHFAIAAWAGASPLPDQAMNLQIGAGRHTRFWSLDTLFRWPGGFGRTLLGALRDGPVGVSFLGLLIGIRDVRARALLAWGLLHCAGVGLAFSNERLVLPAQLAFALGAAWLLPKRPWILAVAALLVGAWNVRPLLQVPPREQELATLAAASSEAPGPFYSNSPWFHVRREGWLVGGRQLGSLRDSRGLTPERLAARMRTEGVGAVALEVVRLPTATPGLVPMMRQVPPGFTLVAETPGWRVFALTP